MTGEVKRYGLMTPINDDGPGDIAEELHGDYVTYADHAAVVAELNAYCETLRKANGILLRMCAAQDLAARQQPPDPELDAIVAANFHKYWD